MSSSSARHRLALLALAAVLASVPAGALGRTAATFTEEATTAGVVGTVRACVGDPGTYTSGMLDAAAPLLRWSFSGTTVPEAGPAGTATTGLLVCDPVDLAAGGDAGPSAVRSLDLAGGVGGGLTSAPVATTGTATLLLWIRVEPGAADGELVSLGAPTPVAAPEPAPEPTPEPEPAPAPSDEATDAAVTEDPAEGTTDGEPAAEPAPAADTTPTAADGTATTHGTTTEPTTDAPATAEDASGTPSDALVLSVAGDTLQLSETHAGTTAVLATVPLTRGESRLVSVVVGVDAVGTPEVSLAVGDAPASTPVPLTGAIADVAVTVGARPTVTAAVARVDEVTVLPTGLTAAARSALTGADRWWSAPPAPPG